MIRVFHFFANLRGAVVTLFFAIEVVIIIYVSLLNQSALSYWQRVFPFSNSIILGVLLALITVLFFSSFRPLRSGNFFSSQATLVTFLVIMGVGVFLRFQVPLRHYLFHDEHYLLHNAQMINRVGIPGDCYFGVFKEGKLNCIQFDDRVGLVKLKSGYPFLLAGVFRLIGQESEVAAFLFNTLLGTLTVGVAFLVGKELWSESAGLFSAALLSVLPLHIWWSATTSLEVPALFFLLTGLLAFLIFLRKKEYHLFALSSLLIIYAAFIRPELILALSVLIGITLIDRTTLRSAWQSWQNVLLTIIASLFATIHIVSILLQKSIHQAAQVQGAIFSWEYFVKNISQNLSYHMTIQDYWLATILFGTLLGIYCLAGKSWRGVFVMDGLAMILFFFYTSYLFGGYAIDLSSLRFTLLWITLLTIGAGIGFDTFWKCIGRMLFLQSLQEHHVFIPIFLIVAIFTGYLENNYTRFIPIHSSIEIVKEQYAKRRFQERNPHCLYVADAPVADIFYGYDSLWREDFENKRSYVLARDCVIAFETYSCRQCATDLSKYRWKKLPYDGVPTWQMASTQKQEKTFVFLPPSPSSSYVPQSMMTIVSKKVRMLLVH